jgi:hypothetical protein
MSYVAQLDSTQMFSIYGESNGIGGVQYAAVAVGATSTPSGFFTIQQATSTSATSTGLYIAASDGDFRTMFMDTSNVLQFWGGSGNRATLSAAGGWTNAPSFSYLKQDREVVSKDLLLDILATTSIETFKLNADVVEYGASADTQLGIVLDYAHPYLVDHDGTGRIIGYSPIRTAAAALRGVQLFTDIIDVTNAPIATSTLYIDSLGNIGVGTSTGTSTLSYKVQVAGDIAATGFINVSTRDAKKDITYLNASTTDDMLKDLKTLGIAEYRYADEDATSTLRMGLIAEEAPERVLSADKKGVDLYKLVTFNLAASQRLALKVDELEARIKAIEDNGGVSGGISTQGFQNMMASMGVSIADGIFGTKKVVTEEIAVTPNQTTGDAAAGSATIVSGASSVTVSNAQVTGSSKIFITFNGVAPIWYVSDKSAGSFTVTLAAPASADLEFDYLIVGVEGAQQPITPPQNLPQNTNDSQTGGDDTAGTSTPEGENTPPAVPDETAPVVSLNGDASVTLTAGSSYVDAGIAATDDRDTDLSFETKVNGEVVQVVSIDTATSGTYTIIYSATDDRGNTGSVARTVTVEAAVEEIAL